MTGNDQVENHLVQVERAAYSRGLSPEAVAIMLEFAMSLRMGKITAAEFVIIIVFLSPWGNNGTENLCC